MSSKLKYFIIPYIAIGLTMSVLFGVRYICIEPLGLPTYYGNPFVFKETSLGTSLAYRVDIWPFLLNIILHCLVLILIHYSIQKLIKLMRDSIVVKTLYGIIVGVFVGLSTIALAAEFVINSNEYYWQMEGMDEKAEIWGTEFEGEWFSYFR